MSNSALTALVVVLAVLTLVVPRLVAGRAARRCGARRRGAELPAADRRAGAARRGRAAADGVARALRHLAVVRYDAFGDMGGRLSWSMALLDEGGNGIVLTSIHGRSDARTYAKNITAWAGGPAAVARGGRGGQPGQGLLATTEQVHERVHRDCGAPTRLRRHGICMHSARRQDRQLSAFMPKLLPQITATDKALQQVTKGRVTILRHRRVCRT